MLPDNKQQLLDQLPSMTGLLKHQRTLQWLDEHPRDLVAGCLRQAIDGLRQQLIEDVHGRCGPAHVTAEVVLDLAEELLHKATQPRIRRAINATGIILHTGLGRAVYPEGVVDSIVNDLKGYITLAIDRDTGGRAERDELLEPILCELTGAEAATVVNNNAAATMLVLAALAAQREVIVSRGQLVEIGGSFRLPEVMAQSQARLVEVGSTNRTHLKDYRAAITDNTAAIMRVHPSNYRVVGFTSEVSQDELVELAHSRNLMLLDDLGAGALVDMGRFGLPSEPTVQASIRAGADLVLFSADKLIGASQGGVIVGRKALIERLRKHPLWRAMRVGKGALMVLERTLHLFRNPDLLPVRHPTYRMICASIQTLRDRARRLVAGIETAAPGVATAVEDCRAYLGSGSLPTEAIPSVMVTVSVPNLKAGELAHRLRMDPAAVFGRIEADKVRLDLRTVTDDEAPLVAEAVVRIATAARPAGCTA